MMKKECLLKNDARMGINDVRVGTTETVQLAGQ
jgi:hypothetical protein